MCPTSHSLCRSHLIDPASLRVDKFEAFMTARREALLGLIERAMGERVYRGTAPDEPEGPIVEDEDPAHADNA